MSEEHKQPISSLLQFVPVPRARCICSHDGLHKGVQRQLFMIYFKRDTQVNYRL